MPVALTMSSRLLDLQAGHGARLCGPPTVRVLANVYTIVRLSVLLRGAAP